ncbi:MAG: OmpA family protein [Paludibacteraceae bacterium]
MYFDFDKTDLDAEAHKAIRIAADKLSQDPSLLIEVRGFTDNMGNVAYNQKLSQRRADKVKNELVAIYNIDPKRIIANGKGKYNPKDKTMPHRPYRTCALFYSK